MIVNPFVGASFATPWITHGNNFFQFSVWNGDYSSFYINIDTQTGNTSVWAEKLVVNDDQPKF